ncbi:transmembrane protein 268 [Cheilinus undulatus]|uniref:transmembrane protein 268 n=1 Tax=Cheilinus undulatus TaxID=241271 RepID=UPI001BD3DE5A|nr:transmembrane protein 268 [Cheilinus undulatus]
MQDVVSSQMMAEKNGGGHLLEEDEVDTQIRPKWSNGRCVLALPTSSTLNPSFDLSLCRAKLEDDGFEIPVRDLEIPLRKALDAPSVRRFMVFHSALFHFIFAPILYMVIWCAVFSTLHVYITVSDYWVLCLSVSMVTIFITTTIIFILHYSNKDINMNLDVRLIQVNERLIKHKLLVAVADWVQNCKGNMKLYFVYWDMSHCLTVLTETLDERSFGMTDTQKRMKKTMSHLILVTEINPEVGGSDMEQDLDEQRPLLGDEEIGCSTSSSQREDTKITTSYSLIPDESLSPQVKAYQLLMTYSAAYVKLLVSQSLPGSSYHRQRSRRNHCSNGPLCLCQYVTKKILQ